jgi:hypothetical protein
MVPRPFLFASCFKEMFRGVAEQIPVKCASLGHWDRKEPQLLHSPAIQTKAHRLVLALLSYCQDRTKLFTLRLSLKQQLGLEMRAGSETVVKALE